MNDRKRFDELRVTGRLPSPSGMALAILGLTQREDFSAEEMGELIAGDSALTGRVIKMANSARHASIAPVVNVPQCIVRLGARTIRNLSLSFSLVTSHRFGTCQGFDYDRYWSESLARAIAAQILSEELGLGHAPDAHVCGLLSGIGRLALACVHPESYTEVLQKQDVGIESSLIDLEREHLGIDHQEVAEAMLLDWGLPKDYASAVRNFEKSDSLDSIDSELEGSLIQTLRMSVSLADVLLAGDDVSAEQWLAFETVQFNACVEPVRFNRICDRIADVWVTWGRLLGVVTRNVPSFRELGDIARRNGSSSSDRSPVPSSATAAASDEPDASDEAPYRVLLVDDDRLALKLLQHQFASTDFEILTARSGREALNIALDGGPHIVITDWMMPDIDGVSLCRALRQFESGRGMYVIILTALDTPERCVAAFEGGADDFVTKPFNPEVLLARARAGLRVVRLQQQLEQERRGLGEQVSKLAVVNRQIDETAKTDELTGLANRRSALKIVSESWPETNGSPLSVIMLDLDEFKAVNDTYGHDVGDRALQTAAEVLRTNTRSSEVVGRWGGEEFLIICKRAGMKEAQACAERLRANLESKEIAVDGHTISITGSFGVASTEQGLADFDELLKAADTAVYEAKATGRNQVVVAPPHLPVA